MAYYIFLKSLRSLEEFRKNPHVKIPPKSPSTIFQSLAIIKNQILFRKDFFLHIRPHRPPFSPAGRARARPIPVCLGLAYLPKAVSSSSLRSPAMTPSPSLIATQADPDPNFSTPLPRASDAPELLQPSLITLPP
jgi:hypothetical protein